MNELVNYNVYNVRHNLDESWLKNMEDGPLPAPEDHIQNHIMQLQGISTVLPLLRVIKIKLNNL